MRDLVVAVVLLLFGSSSRNVYVLGSFTIRPDLLAYDLLFRQPLFLITRGYCLR